MVQLLGLEKIPIKGKITGIGGDQFQSGSIASGTQICRYCQGICIEKVNNPFTTGEDWIDLILGAEVYGQIIFERSIKGPPDYTVAQNTEFGWILSGCIGKVNHSETIHNCIGLHSTQQEEIELLKNFENWSRSLPAT